MADIKATPEQPAEPGRPDELVGPAKWLGITIMLCMIVLVLFLTIWAVREIVAHW